MGILGNGARHSNHGNLKCDKRRWIEQYRLSDFYMR